MSIYDSLNDMQKEAVYQTEGPVLILAGAGSGKTRVLTHRIAYLIEEKGVNPWNILAITFTNKAAGEMRERVDQLVGFGSESIWVSTFHSACVRILRRFIDRLGYDTNFTIYDTDDQKSLMKEVCRYLQIDTKMYKERALLSAISSAKNEMISPEEYRLDAEGDFSRKKIAEVYAEYEKQLRANNALDFDDLLVKAVQLFQTQPDVLEYYQERFRYIMVDEYQDTNTVQFRLIQILSSKYRNLCVVGDDDQSIYKFRGANIKNILNFEEEFPDAVVIKLEQNYRSTSTILNAANAVIRNNHGRKDKTLWTENPEGEKLVCRQFDNAYDEADYIAGAIQKKVKEEGASYNECAVLYRTNAQSRMFEERFVSTNIPYKVIGGVNFYARREIKDLLAYLRTIENGRDDLAVRRIINVPKRGIGLTSINRVQEYAIQKEIGFYEALRAADLIPNIGRAVSRLESFTALIEHFKEESGRMTPLALLNDIIETLDYESYLEEIDMEDAESRIENVEELKSKVASYEESCEQTGEQPTLSGFLEEVALVADIDNLDEESDYVVLMTLHSAKGLEFPYVFLAGMEDGLFPSYMTITADDPMELEEERRLCYVGITRAMKELTLTCARRRMVRGETQYNKSSRFLREIPEELLGGHKELHKEKPQMEIARNQAYAKAKAAFHSQAFGIKKPVQQFKVASGEGPGYDVGDRVRHMKFGEGLVTAITEGGRDYEVTVEFDTVGVKKMFAAFARLKKVE
ncbi:DNA helicase PcrA [Drancourtella massiliensis]|uniref:ATP-dependent DNA helicase n=1 Tax=Drancourtella massiliensis TaxID=1632013 RepID=A0ABS2EEY5_9FIRM|nr:DNA helicase PcrA [Drancourtella massiliensis]MBM6743423.1 DNA helicase PcrA [Drancourtella massiliensis]